MAKVIVCYKWVLDEADIQVKPDLSLDMSRAKGKIGDYDRNAIQAAVESAEEGDEVVSLTYGSADARKSLKDALSRGPAQGFIVCDDQSTKTDGAGTAKVLASAIKKIGDTKLVVCSEGASDTYSHEVGPRLGVLLNLPVISNVSQMSVNGDELKATRVLNEQLETIQVRLPAVVTILPEVAPAPIPGLKMVLAASKKQTTEFSLADLGLSPDQLAPKTKILELNGFAMNRKNIMFGKGEPAELAQKLVDALVEEGVIA